MVTIPRLSALLVLAAVVIGLALAPVYGETYAIKVATRMVVFAIFAMSLDLLLGYTGLVSFGHAAFFGIAAYSLQIFSPEYEAANLLVALPVVLGVTAAAGALIGALVVRTSGIYFIMVTLAFAQMLFYFFHDSQIAGGSDGAYIWVKPVLALGQTVLLDFESRETLLWFSIAAMLAVYALLVVLLRSPFGQVIQGIKVNEHRMRALGYDTYRYKLVSFVISATVAGLAGFIFACIDGYVAPELLGWHESGVGLVMVILGGMGTLLGPIVGAVAFLGVEELAKERALVGPLAENFQIVIGVFVIAVVLLLKNGLVGTLAGAGKPPAPTPEDETAGDKS
ncbi:MAG: branched-chain amino acid ABC transporter permease [Alphaproteobacteria bacterium]|nr:branched-chain amino acid ABC transporter permease [Alphaproteobacteria bacterium]